MLEVIDCVIVLEVIYSAGGNCVVVLEVIDCVIVLEVIV